VDNKVQSEKFYVIHGTPIQRVPAILDQGILLPADRTDDADRDEDMLDGFENVPIFAQALFNDINTTKFAWWHECALVLKPSVLVDYDFQALKGNGRWDYDPEAVIVAECANDLHKVKDVIVEAMGKKNTIDSYMHSHELIFRNNIPPEYVVAILVRNTLDQELHSANLPVIVVDILNATPESVYKSIAENVTQKGGSSSNAGLSIAFLSMVVCAMSVLGSVFAVGTQ
jgi:hypothetical protein